MGNITKQTIGNDITFYTPNWLVDENRSMNDGNLVMPDEFEGTITLFNGKELYSDPLDPDTDDDGLPDGEEIRIGLLIQLTNTAVD